MHEHYSVYGELDDAQWWWDRGQATQKMVQAWGNFAFDRLGRVTQYTDYFNGGQVDYVYTYDTAGRLTHVFDGASTTTYTYDDAGNRLTRARTGQPTEVGVYNALDQLVSYDGRTYTYDDAGRLTSVTGGGQTTSYTWDVWGQLRRVDLPGGDVIEYAIDGAGRRVGRKKNGAWTARWVYGAGLGPVAELDADGRVAKRFVYGRHANVPDYVVTLTRTSTTTLESVAAVVHDRRGGVRELIAMSDSLSPVHTTYDEYGRVSDPNPVNVGVAVPFGFAGGMFDPETGLVHLGAREYDPQTGRWLTPDPIGFAGGPNLYGYVLADPINYIDPSGFGPDGSLGFFGDSQFWGDWLDNYQNTLGWVGMLPIPGLGEVADGLDLTINLLRGNWVDAGISAAALIPIFGTGARAVDKANDLRKTINVADGISIPRNLTPPGSGRRGAFRQAKRDAGIPNCQQPTKVGPNIDRRGGTQPGRQYEFGNTVIRDDSAGHFYGPGNPQNRGPHFNSGDNSHYDY